MKGTVHKRTQIFVRQMRCMAVIMNIGVIGLGLMGGSLAKALRYNTEHTVWGTDIDESTVLKAKLLGAVEDSLTDEKLTQCDLVITALFPEATVKYIKENSEKFKKGATVMDICGVKRFVCNELNGYAKEHGFVFLGAHPMAGYHLSGFEHSKVAMFSDASMILTPDKDVPINVLADIKELFLKIGFTNIQFSTPEEHDRIIAFTSQLAHVVSNAYVKSPEAKIHKGFSAGSYKDLTRVAHLNEVMWSELFLENSDNLINEITAIVDNLNAYKAALQNNDRTELERLLREGRILKEKIDGE